jgi:hypothetical protein
LRLAGSQLRKPDAEERQDREKHTDEDRRIGGGLTEVGNFFDLMLQLGGGFLRFLLQERLVTRTISSQLYGALRQAFRRITPMIHCKLLSWMPVNPQKA